MTASVFSNFQAFEPRVPCEGRPRLNVKKLPTSKASSWGIDPIWLTTNILQLGWNHQLVRFEALWIENIGWMHDCTYSCGMQVCVLKTCQSYPSKVCWLVGDLLSLESVLSRECNSTPPMPPPQKNKALVRPAISCGVSIGGIPLGSYELGGVLKFNRQPLQIDHFKTHEDRAVCEIWSTCFFSAPGVVRYHTLSLQAFFFAMHPCIWSFATAKATKLIIFIYIYI